MTCDYILVKLHKALIHIHLQHQHPLPFPLVPKSLNTLLCEAAYKLVELPSIYNYIRII